MKALFLLFFVVIIGCSTSARKNPQKDYSSTSPPTAERIAEGKRLELKSATKLSNNKSSSTGSACYEKWDSQTKQKKTVCKETVPHPKTPTAPPGL